MNYKEAITILKRCCELYNKQYPEMEMFNFKSEALEMEKYSSTFLAKYPVEYRIKRSYWIYGPTGKLELF